MNDIDEFLEEQKKQPIGLQATKGNPITWRAIRQFYKAHDCRPGIYIGFDGDETISLSKIGISKIPNSKTQAFLETDGVLNPIVYLEISEQYHNHLIMILDDMIILN